MRAIKWFAEQGVKIQRSGRDMPGSNWHTYIYDPDGHTNELYFGIEQVGWDGYSKPARCTTAASTSRPTLPQINEFEEVQEAHREGHRPGVGLPLRGPPARDVRRGRRSSCRGRSRS